MNNWTDGPLIFLDIDGVLNSVAYCKRGGSLSIARDGIDSEAVKHLQRIVDETGCSLVLSSTWRLMLSLSDMRGRLAAAGMRHPVPLRDKTPDLTTLVGPLYAAKNRGDEVRQWIETMKYTGRYICIDDDADFYPDQNLVRTSHDFGLTSAIADRCIELLKQPLSETG